MLNLLDLSISDIDKLIWNKTLDKFYKELEKLNIKLTEIQKQQLSKLQLLINVSIYEIASSNDVFSPKAIILSLEYNINNKRATDERLAKFVD